MSKKYSPPLATETDADSPLNETLFDTRIRGTLNALGLPGSVFNSFTGDGSANGGADKTYSSNDTLDCTSNGVSFTNLTISAGVTVTLTTSPGIHKIGVQGTFTMEAGAILDANGTGYSGGSGGAAVNYTVGNPGSQGGGSQRIGIGQAVAAGGGGGGGGGTTSGQNGGAGGASGYTLSKYVTGGSGGHGGTSPGAGNAGNSGSSALGTYSPRWYGDWSVLTMGTGGGGGGSGGGVSGGGSTGGAGGAGGSGGGLVIIECDTLVFNSGAIIRANATSGANANPGINCGGGGGGGGGGSGGGVIIICRTATVNSGTVQANGGSGGNGGAGGGLGGAVGGSGGSGGAGFLAVVVLS